MSEVNPEKQNVQMLLVQEAKKQNVQMLFLQEAKKLVGEVLPGCNGGHLIDALYGIESLVDFSETAAKKAAQIGWVMTKEFKSNDLYFDVVEKCQSVIDEDPDALEQKIRTSCQVTEKIYGSKKISEDSKDQAFVLATFGLNFLYAVRSRTLAAQRNCGYGT